MVSKWSQLCTKGALGYLVAAGHNSIGYDRDQICMSFQGLCLGACGWCKESVGQCYQNLSEGTLLWIDSAGWEDLRPFLGRLFKGKRNVPLDSIKSRMSIILFDVPLPLGTMIGMHHHKLYLCYAILNSMNAMRFLAIHRATCILLVGMDLCKCGGRAQWKRCIIIWKWLKLHLCGGPFLVHKKLEKKDKILTVVDVLHWYC